MPHRRTARLAGWQRWLLCLSGGGLWLTGSAWLLLHYYGQQEGEFGPEMNPLEPLTMQLHGLVLIPALMGIGAMLVAHIPKGWAHVEQRIAGVVLCALLVTLIASGYLLYYAGGEDLRAWSSLAHWSIGLALPLVFGWHWVNGVSIRRKGRARRGSAGRVQAAVHSDRSSASG